MVRATDRPELLLICKYLMLVLGIWKLDSSKPAVSRHLYLVYSVTFQSLSVILFGGILVQIPSTVGNPGKFVESVGFCTISLLIICKSIICRTPIVEKLITRIINQEKKIYEEENEDIIKNYIGYVNFAKQWNIVFCILAVLLSLSLGLSNFIIYLQNVRSTPFIDKYLNPRFDLHEEVTIGNETLWVKKKIMPFEVWFPFDIQQHYGLAIAIYIVCGWPINLYNTFTQLLFSNIMLFIIAELRALQFKLRNFINEIQKEGVEVDERVYARLRYLIHKHQDIIGFTVEFNNGIKYVILVDYLLNSINIASLMYRIPLILNSMVIFITYLVMLLVVVLQLFVMCWNANEIQIQSISLSDALFESNWQTQSKRTKQVIQFMILRAQRPLIVKVGPLFPLRIEVALTTMKAAFSYVSMMAAIYGEK